jgi:hypothetical protein
VIEIAVVGRDELACEPSVAMRDEDREGWPVPVEQWGQLNAPAQEDVALLDRPRDGKSAGLDG